MNASGLSPWASDPSRSRGRRVAESPPEERNEHQRDRDRIVHSTAFRRLVYKTQVFINHEGDLFRTRLTHSLEVAQLGRSVARALSLNEDLVEAIALAHDLGHTPFGHAGQDALAACMAGHGGFEHNLQSLRVVDRLEARYPGFDGLNLTFETREGILKHCSAENARALTREEANGPAARFLNGLQASLEAQLVNLTDELAYSTHDVDDGVRSGLISLEQALEVPLLARWRAQVIAEYPALQGRRLLYEVLRRNLSGQVNDLIRQTRSVLSELPQAQGTRAATAAMQLPALPGLSPTLRRETTELRQFLFKSLYRHPRVVQMTSLGRQVVSELFLAYCQKPGEMPREFMLDDDLTRGVADYIAGMTDRFALREHERLTGRRLFD